MSAELPLPPAAPSRCRAVFEVETGLVEHRASLYKHAYRRTRDVVLAEDVLQEACVRALAFAWSYEPGTNVRAWLHQVLESSFLSRCRRRVRERRALDAMTFDPCAWTRKDASPPMASLSPRVKSALAALPVNFREVLCLVDIADLSYRDAAEQLDVPLGTVMSRLFRARQRLAGALSDLDEARTASSPARAA
jgi:RNA polymerase sigma-70 factor (ECF subfamily)